MSQVSQHESAAEAVDPRVVRSRRMLMEALARLLNQKDFADISVQEIADEATLNRATFYLHYPDKTALLRSMTESRFRDLVQKRGLSFDNCDSALRAIALGVCDYLTESANCPTQLVKLSLESSIVPAVENIFREGGKKRGAKSGADLDLLATTAAWAIFGAARTWYQTPNRIPAEQMAEKIEALVKPIFLSVSAR